MAAVMSMHKLTAGQGYRYLTRHVAAGDAGLTAADSLSGYYAVSGNPPGRWYGTGLAGLGTERARLRPGDRVSEDAMAALFGRGHDPITGNPLGRPYPQFDATAAAAPGGPGAGRGRHAVVGYDMTFTVPKSVSVLWALGDEVTRREVYAAHHAAVASALEFVEARVIRTRVGQGGARQVKTAGMVAAGFDHWDTRTGDPNLHTHVVVANKVQGPDGAWRSVDGRTVHAAVVTVSELYDTLLADEVTRRLGVDWDLRARGSSRNPAFEITGIDDKLLTAFSSRSEAIHEAVQDWAEDFETAHGRAPSRVETTKARQHLTRATRPDKVVRPLADLLGGWADRARAVTGQEPLDVAAAALRGEPGRALRADDVGPEIREVLVAAVLEDVATRRSVWTTWNLGAAALRASKHLRMATPTERLTLLNEVTAAASRACVHLDDARDPDTRRVGESLFTTTELLAAEKVLLDAAEARTVAVPRQARLTGERFAGLAADQRAAIEAVCTSGRALDVLVGPAGAGKTTTLAALVGNWTDRMGPVVALAPSASAAHTLAAAIGAPAETTAKWLHESVGDGAAKRAADDAVLARALTGTPDRSRAGRMQAARAVLRERQEPWRFTRGQLVIIDEASLADTRTLATLTVQAREVGAKVLLVGDHAQRGAVGAGGAFGMLARRGPTAELTSLWRFTNPWEARASLELRRGHTAALDAYAAHGALHAGDLDTMLDTALEATAAAATGGRVAILQAVDTRTVRELNARVRADRILTGHVARDGGTTLHDGLTVSAGDRVVTRRNNRHLATPDGGYVRNGALWDVVAVDRDGTLHATPASRHSPEDGATAAVVRLPAGYVAEHVELGYATTTARSQGITVDESHTIATPGMGREDLYVAMTRGRHTNHTYVALPDDHHDCHPQTAAGPTAPTTTPAAPTPAAAARVAAPATGLVAGRDVLEQILATSHAERSATETWHDYHPDQPPPLPPLTHGGLGLSSAPRGPGLPALPAVPQLPGPSR